MSAPAFPLFAHALRLLLVLLLMPGLLSCATLGGRDPLSFQVVGIEPLRGEGLEVRLAVKLRVQNPNAGGIDYSGVALELKVNGRLLARGVSAQHGRLPGFGESVIEVPVSISAFAALRQALGMVDSARLDNVPYVLRGKLGGGWFGSRRFSDAGVVDLSRLASGRE